MRSFAALIAVLVSAQSCFAWTEGGHHLISVIAFDVLSADQQRELLKVLKSHPRFGDDFTPPPNLADSTEIERWVIGRAGYWPDVARSQPAFNRPQWHYQLGATLTVGEVAVPARPGPLPPDATMETENLYIAQAVELCRSVLRDKSRPDSDRSLAICWLIHLVGDAHQPCHAGSFYDAKVFPEGDRGANSIPTIQSKNLHALWDGLLGPLFDAGDVERRGRSIVADRTIWSDARQAATAKGGLNPATWLGESEQFGRSHVYTTDVMKPIADVAQAMTKLEPIDLPEKYLKSAAELARKRAAYAACRLAAILAEDL